MAMLERQKVIKGLTECVAAGLEKACPANCPYFLQCFPDAGLATPFMSLMADALSLLKEQEAVVRCKDCKHGSLYCTEDVCGETLIECNRPDLGDVIEIHGWKWFCADGIMEVKS